ncbi:MAG: hypothetical protein ABI587_17795 [Gemmatimonadales bacterium]
MTSPRTLADLVRRFSSGKPLNEDELHHLVGNPHAPIGIITRLATSLNPEFRGYAARSPQLPERLAVQLCQDSSGQVRASIAAYARSLSLPHWEHLADDPSPAVRASLATNVRVPEEIIEELARDSDAGVREAAQAHAKALHAHR